MSSGVVVVKEVEAGKCARCEETVDLVERFLETLLAWWRKMKRRRHEKHHICKLVITGALPFLALAFRQLGCDAIPADFITHPKDHRNLAKLILIRGGKPL